MKYNYYFDVAALFLGMFILAVYAIRRPFRKRSNIYLLILLLSNILGSAFDIASCFSISFPDSYHMWYNYLTCYGYLLAYNFTGIMYLAYIDSKAKIPKLYKPVRIYVNVMCFVEAILICTSPFTHLVSYFDEYGIYTHGPMMVFLFTIAFFNLLFSGVFFIVRIRQFSGYQVVSLATFEIVAFLGVVIQMLVPELLVGQFGITLVIFLIYTSFEDPSLYMYKGTSCYNRHAFLEIMKSRLNGDKKINLVAFAINDYSNLRENLDLKELDRLSYVIGESLADNFNVNAFGIADDKFVVEVVDDDPEKVRDIIREMFSDVLKLIDTEIKVSANIHIIRNIDTGLSYDIVEDCIIYVLNQHVEIEDEDGFSSIVDKLQRKRNISRILKDAVKNKDFDVYYQPIRGSGKYKYESAEALVRLRSDELGYVSPEEFIPIAEKEGLIIQIGDIVFEKVCSFIQQTKLISRFGFKYIEINMSTIQCEDPDIVRRYRDIMDKYNIVPFWINLEITETAEIETNDMLLKNIIRLHNIGVSFSIDDFGSGFASLDYLFRMPVDLVKIDKSILWQSMKNENAGIVLIGTLRLLKNLDKKIVVEGVESKEMEERLLDNGVDYLQGFYFSKPLPEKEFIEFLEKNNVL